MRDTGCYEEYVRRIHNVQDYIDQNTQKTLTVEELSDVAGFSTFHFSRIFQGITNESPAHYVMRVRLEKSLFFLAHRPDMNLTEIAFESGYKESTVFSRTFRNYFHMSPSTYRKNYNKDCKESYLLSDYNKNKVEEAVQHRDNQNGDLFPLKVDISIKRLPSQQMAYVRFCGDYRSLERESGHLMALLYQGVKRQHLLRGNQNMWLCMYHENPEFTDESKFRTSLCVTVPDDISIKEDGALCKMIIEGGLYAVGEFNIRRDQYTDAWNYMYREWLTGSGYIPRNNSPFEVYLNESDKDPQHLHQVAIYVPVEPLHK